MKIKTEKLLVLKAFYMGYSIAHENVSSTNSALKMIESAIIQLEKRESKEDNIRLLFYILLKSEILRDRGDIITLRKQAKDINEKLKSDIYEFYMDIVEATQTKTQIHPHGITSTITANEGIITHKKVSFTDDFGNLHTISHDIAAEALDIDIGDLSESDNSFLYNTSLKKMLDRHDIRIISN